MVTIMIRVSKLWRRFRHYLKWKWARHPMLLNEDTAELIHFSTLADIPDGSWLLRRTIRTHTTPRMMYVTARVVQHRTRACLIVFRPNVLTSLLNFPTVTPPPRYHGAEGSGEVVTSTPSLSSESTTATYSSALNEAPMPEKISALSPH
jgi:hypothetical protein